jgi:hypothetical protein
MSQVYIIKLMKGTFSEDEQELLNDFNIIIILLLI